MNRHGLSFVAASLFIVVLAFQSPALAQRSAERSIAEDLHGAIIDGGYQRVGILPRFIVREGGKESLGGSLGPQSEYLSERLESELVDVRQRRSATRRYAIVDGRVMREACAGLSLADLGKPERLRLLAQRAEGLDALIVATVVDLRSVDQAESPLSIRAKLVAIDGAETIATVNQIRPLSIADAAFAGESFELWRWSSNADAQEVWNVDLKVQDEERLRSLMRGNRLCQAPFTLIRAKRDHPLKRFVKAAPERPAHLSHGVNSPDSARYNMWITVDGEKRPLSQVNDKMHVALDPGEHFNVHIKNNSSVRVYAAVYVDGINIREVKRDHPSTTELYWDFLPHVDYGGFRGWMRPSQNQNEFLCDEFMIVAADDAIAPGQGFSDRLGIITAVFYASGEVGARKTYRRVPIFGSDRPGYGTGRRYTVVEQIKWTNNGKSRGPIMAAISIYYSTTSRLVRLVKEAKSG